MPSKSRPRVHRVGSTTTQPKINTKPIVVVVATPEPNSIAPMIADASLERSDAAPTAENAHLGEVEESVTLSSASSPMSAGTADWPPLASPSRQPERVETPSEESTVNQSPGANEAVLVNMKHSEQMLYYLEAVRVLRRVADGMGERERFLQQELQRQGEVYRAKKMELEKKQETYQKLQSGTQRLTRQLRALDNENDRLRDTLAQHEESLTKLMSRRVSRPSPIQPQSSISQTDSTKRVGSTRASLVRSSTAGTREVLGAELHSYQKKLRDAETRHEELLGDLQMAVARRRGRAAAYASIPTGMLSGEVNRTSLNSHNTIDYVEANTIRQLEEMINEALTMSQHYSSRAPLKGKDGVRNNHSIL